MGYDLHITRKVHWSDEDGPTISPDEWLAVLDSDPELSRATDAGTDGSLSGAWKGETLFWFDDGEVVCKNPDEAIIHKMVTIAKRLGATVQGDDGEHYPESLPPPKPAARPSLWRRLFGGA